MLYPCDNQFAVTNSLFAVLDKRHYDVSDTNWLWGALQNCSIC